MEKHLSVVVQWTLYVFIVVLMFIGFFVPVFRLIVMREENENLANWMSWFSVGISFISLVLGVVSMAGSTNDRKHSENAFEKIKELQQESTSTLSEIKLISENIKSSQDSVVNSAIHALTESVQRSSQTWKPDTTGTKE